MGEIVSIVHEHCALRNVDTLFDVGNASEVVDRAAKTLAFAVARRHHKALEIYSNANTSYCCEHWKLSLTRSGLQIILLCN